MKTMNGDWATPCEVAAALGVTVKTLYNWRSARVERVPSVKIHNRLRYRRADVDAYLGEVGERATATV